MTTAEIAARATARADRARTKAISDVQTYRELIARDAILSAALRERREAQGIDETYFKMSVEQSKIWRDMYVPRDSEFALARS